MIGSRLPWSQVTRKLTSPFSTPPHSKFPVTQVNCAPYFDDIVIPASHGPEQKQFHLLYMTGIGLWFEEQMDLIKNIVNKPNRFSKPNHTKHLLHLHSIDTWMSACGSIIFLIVRCHFDRPELQYNLFPLEKPFPKVPEKNLPQNT